MRFFLCGAVVLALGLTLTGCGDGNKVEAPKNPAPLPTKGPTSTGAKGGGGPNVPPPPPVEP